jgi:hypothetical protein
MVLDAALSRRVERAELFGALGLTSSAYYRRCKQDDYPNAEELRLVALRFDLNATVMMVSFGLLEENDVTSTAEQIAQIRVAEQLAARVEGGADVLPLAAAMRKGVTTMETGIAGKIRPKVKKFSPRTDAPGI